MKNVIFKSSFHEKLKMLLVLLGVFLGSINQVNAGPWVKLDVSTGKQGTKTVGDKLNGGSEWWYNYQTNGGWNSDTDIQVLIGTSSSSYSTVNASWYADDGSNKKVHANIGNFEFDKSGIWYAVGKYKSGSTTAYTSGTSWTSNTSLSSSMSTSNSPYWEVTPPTVKNFTVSTTESDILSGTGTSSDPYIIAYNGSLVLTLSGSKNKTDANSSLQYNTSGSWNTTTSRTISSITSTTKTSVTVKMRCYNSTASLSGTESTKTIYYQSEPSYTVTINNDGNGTTSPSGAQSNIGQSIGVAVSATASTNYEFVNWTITSGSGTFTGGGTTSTSASTRFYPTSAATIRANFRSTLVYSLTVSAGSGVNSVTGSNADVTLNTKYAITATPKTGYTFSSWTASPAANGTFDNANSASTNVTVKNGSVTVTANASEIMRTITINGGTAASTTAGVVTTGSATAAAPAEGKKFTGWTLGSGVTLSGGALTDRTIKFTATQNSYVTANYADRASVKLYFAKPIVWGNSTFYVHTFKNGGGVSPNAAYPGVACATTETINCVTYYTYQYYTEGDGIGGAATGNAAWDRVIFGCNDDAKKTGDLTISNGHYYYWNSSTTGSASAVTDIWYIKGTMNDWGTTNPITLDCANNKGTVNITLTKGTTYEFKVYDVVNTKMWSNSTACGQGDGITATMANAETLYNNDENVMKITPNVTGSYTFEVSNTNTTSPKIKVTFPVSYTVTYSVSPSAAANAITTSPSVSSGGYVVAGTSVTFTHAAAKTGYEWYRWENGSGSNLGNGNTYTTTISAATTVVAKYTENQYNATVSAGAGGSVSPNGTVAIKQVNGTSITATPSTNYVFKDWTISGGGITPTTSTSATQIFKATTTGGAITANFADQWNVKGDQWDSWATYQAMPYAGTANTFSKTFTLPQKTTYHFKVVKRAAPGGSDVWYGVNNGKTLTRTSNSVTGLEANGGETEYITFTTDVAGDYTITYLYNGAVGSMKVTVTYPTAYTVTFGKGTGGNTISATATNPSGAISSGDYVASGATVTFSQTALAGYTFKGWYTTVDGNTSAGVNGSNQLTINGTKTVYAQYNPKNYIITLDVDEANKGDISGATTSHSVTYNTTVANIPNLPTAANGYAFVGYYTDHNGAGTKLFNSDGSCIASVSGYTDANKKWIRDDNSVKLYAYYKKSEVTAITLSPAGVGTEVTVTATATIDPTPCGTTIVCWRLLRDNDTEISTAFTPVSGTPAAQTAVSFTSPATSAYYKLEAKLRTGSSCGSGTVLNTYVKRFQVAGTHTVTVNYTCGSEGIKASTSVTANPNEWSDDITAPDIFGYTFARWDAGTGVTIKDGTGEDLTTSTSATIKIKATYNGTLTAVYTQKNIVYFKDNLGWTDPDDPDAHIYVNLLQSDYWNDDRGSGNYDRPNRNLQMDRVPGTTDVFYYEYGNEQTSNYISFTKESMGNSGDFYQAAPNVAHVVFPSRSLDDLSTNKATGLGFYAQTPMFVPLANQTPVKKNSNRAEYYNDGYWTKYLPGTGYSLDIYQSDGSTHVKTVAFTSADELMPMKVVTDLEGNHTYKFQLKRDGDVYYGNGGTMTYTDHGQNTPWEFNNSPFSMCTIVTNAAGDYTFNLSFSPNSGGTNNRLRIEVDYPVASGDYRLIYDDDVQANYKASAIIPKKNNSTAIVSFFVRKNSSNPILRIQQATVANDGTITWNEYPTSGTPTNQITGSIASAITKDSVYNFNLSMNGSGALSVTSAEYYSGNFYIRTDCANSKWDNYRTDPDHLMTYSEYSITHGGYSHYYAHWVDASEAGRKNVKFCIANDYSPSISDTLARETASGEWAKIANYITEGGDLIRNANVRFMWNKADNTIKRAYIDGAQDNIHSFLELLSADGKIKDKDEPETLTEVSFSDNENWIYEANIKAQPNAQIKLKSTWGESNVIEQYFVGTSSTTETLIGGSGDVWYDIRLLYDFKTNRLAAAYKPSGEISTDMEINADVMFIREAQDDIDQLTFTGSGAVKDIKTAYGVMKFSKWTLNNKSQESGHAPLVPELSPHERGNFYISFPFRVKLNEVFGFGTYGTHWVIQYYDGAKRAREGYWAESSGFWTFVWDRKDFVLEPNVGYLLLLDLDLLGESSDVWGPNSRSEQIELFFPSYGDMPDLTGADVTVTVPAHECKIDKSKDDKGNPTGLPDTDDPRTSYNRKVFDSHWNIMGVPTYVNTDDVTFANTTWTATKPSFLYTWNMGDNSLSVRSGTGFEYHAMHSYIVQYYGDVTWAAKSGSAYPSSVVARRTYMDKPRNVEFRLEVQQNEKMVDQTFVKLSDEEEVSAGFSFDEDMTKIFNSRNVNIYTFVENMKVAGNTMPMDFEKTTIIPVGVEINADGEYTFSVPDGTEGVGLTLIDNVRGMRTNLALTDYMVELEAGTYDDRFVLEISPIEQIVTGVEMINGENGDATLNGVSKKLIDGVLYIIKDGKVFDARGARIQ